MSAEDGSVELLAITNDVGPLIVDGVRSVLTCELSNNQSIPFIASKIIFAKSTSGYDSFLNNEADKIENLFVTVAPKSLFDPFLEESNFMIKNLQG